MSPSYHSGCTLSLSNSMAGGGWASGAAVFSGHGEHAAEVGDHHLLQLGGAGGQSAMLVHHRQQM